jgi:hypothetical protein
VASETLTCVSCGSQDEAADGDASTLATPLLRGGFQSFHQPERTRVILDDGRILFQTTQSLVPTDINGVADVYLYQHGLFSLISSGTSKYDSEIGDLTPDGHDVFFITRDSLVGQDIDGGARDVYDARVDGGFPKPAVEKSCEGESSCQGKPSSEPGFSPPPTTSAGKGNTPRTGKKAKSRCKGKARKHHKKCGRKHRGKHGSKQASKSGRGE